MVPSHSSLPPREDLVDSVMMGVGKGQEQLVFKYLDSERIGKRKRVTKSRGGGIIA